jgi:iron complex outermembrane recepter protein
MPSQSCVVVSSRGVINNGPANHPFAFGTAKQQNRFSTPYASPLHLILIICLLAVSAFAQATTSLTGTIKDPTGASVGKAVVTLVEDKTSAKRSALTDEAGVFTFSGIAPGSYSIEASAAGFSVYGSKVTVETSATTFDIALELAQQAGQVSVEAKIDPFNVVPTEPTGSLFGLDKSLEDTPRSISTADAETLTRYSVKTVNDLVTVSPGTFTGSYFGIPGSVFIRGDIGDNFFRGFRRVENRGNYETPVAATDHIEIVKGPPSPAYGGGRIGGFMNFLPKTARSESAKWLERPTGKINVTYGSYDEKRASAEVGVPFKVGTHRSGVYGFFEDEDSHSFYKGVANRYQMGQVAFDMELSPKFRLQYGGQLFHNKGTQNIGWNRVTQDLVDKQLYLSGTPLVNLSSNNYDIRPNDIPANILTSFAFQKDMSGPFLSDPAVASLYALNPATVKLVKLPLDQIMIDAGDFTRSTTYTGYFDAIYDIKPGFVLKNQTFYDRMMHQKFSSYGFGADYRPWTVENKTTLTMQWRPSSAVVIHAVGGGGYRRVQVNAGEERNWYQVVDRRDLSIGAQPNDRFAGPFNSSDIFFQYYQTGTIGDSGLFGLTDFLFWNKLGATVGVRYDHFSPDFTGRFDGEALHSASNSSNATTYNASVTYKTPFHFQPYFTVATSRFLDLGQGNEIDVNQVADGTFIQTSNLYEAGVKTSGLPGKVYGSFAYFDQKRSSFNTLTRAEDYFQTKGVEMEARAFFKKRYSVTGAMTWQDPQQLNVPFLLGIPPTLLNLTNQQAYAGRFIGFADIFGLKAPYQVGGQPHWVISPFGTVNVTKNLGFTIGTTWASSVKTGYISDVKLPSYAVWRGSVFYEKGKYRLNLALNNMFEKTYFQSQYLFWDVFIKPGALRTATLTATYTF